MSTLLGVVAFSCFTDSDWKDESCSPFVYPSIVSESPYYDREKERLGKADIDIQVEPSLLKAPDGNARSDVMFVLATGDRKHGHFTLVRVKKEEKCITVCDPYRGCCDDRLIRCCASFIEKAYEEFSSGLVEKELSNPRTSGAWKLVKESPWNDEDPSDKCACGPLCLERLIQWIASTYNSVSRHYGYEGSSPPEEYFCVRRRCVRYMLNALLLHAENVVDREDLVWKGTDNRPGLGDITLATYSKPSGFARYFPDKRGNEFFSYGSCVCENDINQEAPFVQALCCNVTFHMHCFLNWVVSRGKEHLRCFHCQANTDGIRQCYPKLDCDIQFVCIPPWSSLFFRDNGQADDEYNLLYWPAELMGTDVQLPSFNLHTHEGRQELQRWHTANDSSARTELEVPRQSWVAKWMKHTYFFQAYAWGGECNFDCTDGNETSMMTSDLWRIRPWKNHLPAWYRDRRQFSRQVDLTIDDDSEDITPDDVLPETASASNDAQLVTNAAEDRVADFRNSAQDTEAENNAAEDTQETSAFPVPIANDASASPPALPTADISPPPISLEQTTNSQPEFRPRIQSDERRQAFGFMAPSHDDDDASPDQYQDTQLPSQAAPVVPAPVETAPSEPAAGEPASGEPAAGEPAAGDIPNHFVESRDGDEEEAEEEEEAGNSAEGIIQDGVYINSHLDLSIPVSRMHWDPSAGYMRALCDCFYWHVDHRISANDNRRGIPFVVPISLTLRTLNAFSKLFVFNKEGTGMEFHRCQYGGEDCPLFSCYAQLLWHMELRKKMGCEKARSIPMKEAYPFNVMPGYLIDEEILNVLERSALRRKRRHDLIVGDTPPCRFEQRSCLTHRRAWHHDKNSPFYSYLHNNNVPTNHREGNMEYRALQSKGLELFAERHAYMSRRGGRVEPLRDEYPQVYKMPFILEYEKWPTLAQRDYGSGGGL